MKTLKQAIWQNRRFHKYEAMLRRLRLRIFDYEDQGRMDKAQRVIKRIKTICRPWWEKRARRLESERLERLRWW